MGDVGIGGVGGVKGDDSGSIEVLHLLEVRQTDIVYQITLQKSVIWNSNTEELAQYR